MKYLLYLLFFISFSSCSTTMKPDQFGYVNDPDMQFDTGHSSQYRAYIHSIREGSISGSAKKGNGGCGCN